MVLCLLIFSCVVHISLSLQFIFNMTQNENKLLTWNDPDGTLYQILVSQLEIV